MEVEPTDYQLNINEDNQDDSDLKSPTESKYSCDADFSDVSPDHINSKTKKTRRKAQRAKSALEGSDLPSKTSSEKILRSRPSLPARPKLDSIINKDTGVSIVRPWSDQTISRTKQMLESDEITVLDFELMNNVAKAYMPRGAGSARQARKRLDKSIEETNEEKLEKEDLIRKMDKTDFVETANNLQENVEKHIKDKGLEEEKDGISVPVTDKNLFDEKSDNTEKTRDKNILSVKDETANKSGRNTKTRKEIHDRDKEALSDKKTNKLDKKYSRANRETKSADRALPESRERKRLKESNRSSSADSKMKKDISLETAGSSSSQPVLRSFTIPPSSSDSDLSEGEVIIKESIKVRHRPKTIHSSFRIEKNIRPSSAECLRTAAKRSQSFEEAKNRLHSSPTLTANVAAGDSDIVIKPKDIGFTRMTKMLKAASERISSSRDRTPPVTQSQESSTMNLEWLFSTDSDSSGKLTFHFHSRITLFSY